MGGGLREKKGGRCCLLEMGSKIHLGFTFLFLDVYCNTEVHTVALFEVLLAISSFDGDYSFQTPLSIIFLPVFKDIHFKAGMLNIISVVNGTVPNQYLLFHSP